MRDPDRNRSELTPIDVAIALLSVFVVILIVGTMLGLAIVLLGSDTVFG